MSEEATQLWQEWFDKSGDDPLIPSEIDGSLSCFFCGGWALSREEQQHESDCIFVRAKKMLDVSKEKKQ